MKPLWSFVIIYTCYAATFFPYHYAYNKDVDEHTENHFPNITIITSAFDALEHSVELILALSGNKESQKYIAEYFLYTEKNKEKAFKWYKILADEGDKQSQFIIKYSSIAPIGDAQK